MFAGEVLLLTTVALLDRVTGLPQPNCGCQQTPTTTTTTTRAPSTCQETVCEACPTCSYNTINSTIQTDIQDSPYFFYLYKKDSLSVNIDSQCATNIPLNNNTLLLFITTTLLNGTYIVDVFFASNGPQGPGSFEYIGITGANATGGVFLYGYSIDTVCVGRSQTTVFINDLLAEDCYKQGYYANQYTAFTSTLQPDNGCLSQARAILRARSGKKTIIRAPYGLKVTCVGSFNGLPVSNLNKYSGNPSVTFIDYPSYTPISI